MSNPFKNLELESVHISDFDAEFHIMPELFDQRIFFIVEPWPEDKVKIYVKKEVITKLLRICRTYTVLAFLDNYTGD